MSIPTKKLLFIFGTRPEAIKLAPVIKAFEHDSMFQVVVAVTGQHREMLDQVLNFFNIKPDHDLNLMKANQNLFDITANGLTMLEPMLTAEAPDMVLIQGDTTTALIGSLAAYYKKIKVAHIEAGLRSDDKYAPFPEEMNRVLTSHLADLHFAPTQGAADNLQREGVVQAVHVTGNSVIDALMLGLKIIETENGSAVRAYLSGLDIQKRFVLITAHRRESFGLPFENICRAIKTVALSHPDVSFVFPVHRNPNVREPVGHHLNNIPNVLLLDPLDYPRFIALMQHCYFVLTDSGGLQEEAPSLGKPVLVMRDVTERQEGIDAGTAKLVGTDYATIVDAIELLLNNPNEYLKMAQAVNPYGDGKASKRILEIIKSFFNQHPYQS